MSVLRHSGSRAAERGSFARALRRPRPRVWILAPLLLLVAAPALAADARLLAEIRPTEIPLGQTARLVVTITGVQNAPAPRIPAVDGLAIQSLGQTTSVQIVNGEVNAEVTHNFLLDPARTGTFTIPGLAMQVDGERLTTRALTLRVVAADAVPRAGIAPKGGPEDESGAAPVSLKLTAPQRDLYVGELLPVKLTLYIREGVRVTEVTAPTFAGEAFTVSRPQDSQPEQTTEVIDGVRWVVATFPLAISPVTAGEFPLTGKIDVTAYVPGGRRRGGAFSDPFFDAFFGGGGGAQKKIPLATAARTVRVLPIPETGRPASFTGAIGEFTVQASATPAKVLLGDPVTMTVTVKGTGNFDRLAVPEMSTDAQWKAYPASSRFEPTDALGTSGRRVSEQAIVALDPKLKAIPPRSFSYFDPDARRYVELATQPIALTIEAPPRAAGPGGIPAGGASRSADGTAAAEQWELAPNQIAPGTPRAPGAPVATRAWFLLLQLLPLAGLAAGALLLRRSDRLRADPVHLRRVAARRRVEGELAQMERAAQAGDARAFFAAARRALQERLARDPERAAESLTLAELEALVGERPAIRDELRAIVGRADAVAYSGEQMLAAHLHEWLQRVRDLLHALDASGGRR